MTLGMVLTIIIIVCTVVGGAAGLAKSIFVEAPRDWEIEKQYRDVKKPKAAPKPRKRSYTVIYKDTRRRK